MRFRMKVKTFSLTTGGKVYLVAASLVILRLLDGCPSHYHNVGVFMII